MIKDDYEFKHMRQRRERRERREKAIHRIANGSPPVCAICGCPHIEILQFGHYKGDGSSHRKETGSAKEIIAWIFHTPLEEVLERIQLECPYCNFWHGLHGEYPEGTKRPNWDHVEEEIESRESKLCYDQEYKQQKSSTLGKLYCGLRKIEWSDWFGIDECVGCPYATNQEGSD